MKTMPRKLPTFQGYTVDIRLQEFRKLIYGKRFEIIPFKSSKGIDLISLADQILDKVKQRGGNRVYSSVDLKGRNGSHVKSPIKTSNLKLLRTRLDKLTKKSNQNLVESIFAFAKTIELKDHYTGEHVEKTVHYADGPFDGIEELGGSSVVGTDEINADFGISLG